MPEVRFTVPATVLDYGSDDDIGSERALLWRVIIGYSRVLDRIIGGQTHHSPARRIEIKRIAVWICDAYEVRRVFEKRHKYLTLILGSLAQADIANKRLPTAVGQDVCTHLDRHE